MLTPRMAVATSSKVMSYSSSFSGFSSMLISSLRIPDNCTSLTPGNSKGRPAVV
ncbi:MAG: hypothetical protein CM1200mP2_17940 [Planctomycetaceae bacterium]|nr:MAG: hypothetical protein CM1200mP2_17940 [Planctomycetaceae bacterium]